MYKCLFLCFLTGKGVLSYFAWLSEFSPIHQCSDYVPYIFVTDEVIQLYNVWGMGREQEVYTALLGGGTLSIQGSIRVLYCYTKDIFLRVCYVL